MTTQADQIARLRECPFCGERDTAHLHTESLNDGHYIVCLRCGAKSGMWPYIEEATESWSTRASDAIIDQLQGEVAERNATREEIEKEIQELITDYREQLAHKDKLLAMARDAMKVAVPRLDEAVHLAGLFYSMSQFNRVSDDRDVVYKTLAALQDGAKEGGEHG